MKVVKIVRVNFPQDKNELINKTSVAIAKILVNRLKPSEIEKLIEVLQKDTISKII